MRLTPRFALGVKTKMTLLTTDGKRVQAVEMAVPFVFLGHYYHAGWIVLFSSPRRVLTPSELKGWTVLAADDARQSMGIE